MVGAGTGMAPMKGFWEEREEFLRECKDKETKSEFGKAILFFGCRNSSEYLYKEEVERSLELGALTDVFVAYSREPGVRKTYVQDKIKEQQELVGQVLSNPNSHFYICGDTRMANSVSMAISKIIGQKALESMVNDGRWHEDVFGIVSNAKEKLDGAKAIGKTTELHYKMRALLLENKIDELKETVRLVEMNSAPSGTRVIDLQSEYGNSFLHIFAAEVMDM